LSSQVDRAQSEDNEAPEYQHVNDT
jgi:hypothetical protein